LTNKSIDAGLIGLLVDIVEARSISKAAQKLNVTRASISLRLKHMEEAAGVQLIRRTTRSLEPTEAGRRLFEHGLRIRDELSAAQRALDELSGTSSGEVRVCVPTGFGAMVVSAWMLDFRRLHPRIVLHVLFENAVDDLVGRDIDVSMRITSSPSPALVARELVRIKYLACVSPDYALREKLPDDVSDLENAPLLTSDFIGTNLRITARRGGQRAEVRVKPAIVSSNFMFIRDAVLSGLGIGLLPDYMVEKDIDAGRIRTILEEWDFDGAYGNSIFLLRAVQRFQTSAVRTFVSFMIEKAQSLDEERHGRMRI
jgi:DNA-binding transcriptional LysR family regulator